MTLEELFIDGQQVDIKDTSIVRRYQTPYFSDVTKLLSDTTYTITLPDTERNKAVMEYLHESDMNTDFPYTIHKADYYCEGLQLIRQGEVKVLGDFEIQIVYGIDREKYLPLKETKLNEIVPNGTTILESDWVVDWNYDTVTDPAELPATAKFEFLNYISGIRKSDAVISGGVQQPQVVAPAPFLANKKAMTVHPYVSFNNLLDLVSVVGGISNTLFDIIKTRLTNKGLLIGGNKTNKIDNHIYTYTSNTTYTYSALNGMYLGFNYNLVAFSVNVDALTFYTEEYRYYVDRKGKFNVTYNLKTGANAIIIEVRSIPAPTSLITTINRNSYDGTYSYFEGEINLDVVVDGGIIFCPKGSSANTVIYSGSVIDVKYKVGNSVYVLTPKPAYTDFLKGHFNILFNLPNQSLLEYIQQCLIMTGSVIGNDFKVSTYDEFKTNYNNGNVYDWSGRISNVKNSKYQFNSNAQKNWIKFMNSDKLTYRAKESLNVSDLTLTAEKDLYNLPFDLGERSVTGITEHLIYEQDVKKNDTDVSFSSEYKDMPNITVSKIGKDLYNENVLPNNSYTLLQYKEFGIGYFINAGNGTTANPSGGTANTNIVILDTANTTIQVGWVLFKFNSINCNAVVTNISGSTITINKNLFSVGVPNYSLHFSDGATTNKIFSSAFVREFTIGEQIDRIDNVEQTNLTVSNIETNYIELSSAVFTPNVNHSISSYKTVGFVEKYYSVYQKLINRPIVKECNVNLDFYESAQIDFTKPIYIAEWGKYCMLLELTAPNKGLCEAKLLLINQTL